MTKECEKCNQNLDASVLVEVSRANDAMTADLILQRVFPEIRSTLGGGQKGRQNSNLIVVDDL